MFNVPEGLKQVILRKVEKSSVIPENVCFFAEKIRGFLLKRFVFAEIFSKFSGEINLGEPVMR